MAIVVCKISTPFWVVIFTNLASLVSLTHAPKFQIPLSRSCVSSPIKYTCQVSSTSARTDTFLTSYVILEELTNKNKNTTKPLGFPSVFFNAVGYATARICDTVKTHWLPNCYSITFMRELKVHLRSYHGSTAACM